MSNTGQPIEPFIRLEAPPDEIVVVIRGGPISAEKIVEHSTRQQAVYTYGGRPMIAISVDLTIEGWSFDRILRERMWSRSTFATTTVGELRIAGYELIATNAAPHYSVVLPDTDEASARDFLGHFGPTMVNEYKHRRR